MPFAKLQLRAAKPAPAGYPTSPQTLGEHLRKRRIDLGLTQQRAAELLRANAWTLRNWETDRTCPRADDMGRIVDFLEYFPLHVGSDLPSRIRAGRLRTGLTQERLAERLGIDPSTVWKWERGKKNPDPRLIRMFEAFATEAGFPAPRSDEC